MLPPAVAVSLVLTLLCGLLWLARRKGLATLALSVAAPRAGRAPKQLRVVERVSLAGQHSLHLVACAGRLLVVAVSPGGCSTLADLAEPSREALSAGEALSVASGARS
jgi:flagellar biosynthetic protein FliO